MLRFLGRELKHEAFGEAFGVSFDSLVESFCFNAIEDRKIAIQDDLNAADREDARFDVGVIDDGGDDGCRSCRHKLAVLDVVAHGWDSRSGAPARGLVGIHDPTSFAIISLWREAASRHRPMLGVA